MSKPTGDFDGDGVTCRITGEVIANKRKLREKIENDTQYNIIISILWIIGLIVLSKICKDFDGIQVYICITIALFLAFLRCIKAVILETIRTYVYPYIDAKENKEESNDQAAEKRS